MLGEYPVIYGKYNRPEKVYEEVDKTRLTEQAGYIPAHIQVGQLIAAGKRLNDYREEQYDFRDDASINFNLEDPTREGNFDLADASQLQQLAAENMQATLDSQPESAEIVEEQPPETAE